MKEDPKPDQASAQPPQPPEPPAKEASETPRKPGYVFKIVPADPKNAFDFEDVADK